MLINSRPSRRACAAKRTRLHQRFGVGQSESYPRSLSLKMAKRNRQRIRGVGRLRRFRHGEECPHHQLHLAFVGVAVTGDAGFHFARRIAVDGDAVLRGGQQHHAANFGQTQSGSHIEGGEH